MNLIAFDNKLKQATLPFDELFLIICFIFTFWFLLKSKLPIIYALKDSDHVVLFKRRSHFGEYMLNTL